MDFKTFKERYQKEPVTHVPNHVSNKPVVSICVQAYQHAAYIKDCLDGLLTQKTEFPYEILIGEDASTDGTREICLEYAEKHPEKIRLFLHERENNVLVRGEPSGVFTSAYNFFLAEGEYMAICDGDDYWTDPLKLQKQVDFLEENPDCTLCTHGYKTIFIDGSQPDEIHSIKSLKSKKISSEEIIGRMYIRTLTMLFRVSTFDPVPDLFFKSPYGDYPIQLICAHKGSIGYLGGESMAVYRRGVKGSYNEKVLGNKKEKAAISLKRTEDHLKCMDLFNELTNYKYNSIIEERKRKWALRFLFYFQDGHSKKETLKMTRKFVKKPFRLDTLGQAFWIRFILGKQVYDRLKRKPKPF